MDPPCLYLLKEFQSGYALFNFSGFYKIALNQLTLERVRELKNDPDQFTDVVNLVAFRKFDSERDALKQITAFSKGLMTAELRKFLLLHLPEIKAGKKNNFSLGVADPELGYNMYEVAKIPCQSTDFIRELLLGADLHIARFIKDFDVTKVATENVDNEGSKVDSVGNSDDKGYKWRHYCKKR